MNKIALFVDVQNIYYTTRHCFGKQFNYRRLWERVSSQGDIIIANAYATDRNDNKQKSFQTALFNIGFQIKLKPWIQRKDGSTKGDWDVGITIDILDAAPKADTIILLSGDGDFDMLLEKVQKDYHTKTEVYGVRQLTAQSLIQACSSFHQIDQSLLLA